MHAFETICLTANDVGHHIYLVEAERLARMRSMMTLGEVVGVALGVVLVCWLQVWRGIWVLPWEPDPSNAPVDGAGGAGETPDP